jgi:hypothetical protein
MAPNAAELLKRAFAPFETIAKRDPRTPGAVEVDLGKVATEMAKAATTLGATGDVDALEKALDEYGALLEKSTYDAATDKVYSAATELAKRVSVSKEDGRYYVDHGSGAAKAPAKGSKEQKDQEYTAEGGLANEKGEQYTQSAAASVATTPSGAPAIGFDQPAGGPQATKKAAAPAKPTRTNEGALAAEGETAERSESAISEGKQGRRAAKRIAKSAGPVTTEEVWALDMAAMTAPEVAEVRRVAKAQAMGPEAEVDEVDEKKAKAKKAGKPGYKAHDAGPAEGAEVDEVKAKKAAGKGPEAEVDEVDGEDSDEAPAEATDDRSSADAKRKKAAKAKKKQGGAEGGYAAGADDVDTVKAGKKKNPFADEADDEDEDEEDGGDDEAAEGEDDEKPFPKKKGKTAKSADDGETSWPTDLSPALSPVGKAARLTAREVGAKASGARGVAKRHAEIRKAALEETASDEREPEEIPGDELSPDQVAELRKRAKLSPAQQRRENARRLKQAEYVPGSREIEIAGIEDADISNEE